MDSKTPVSELKEIVKKFCEERDWDQFHSPKDLAIGLVTESSELLEIFRFKSNEEIKSYLDDSVKREQINDEVSDIFYFVLRFAQLYKLDLVSELNKKLAKNAIKYPVARAKGSNKKYNEL